MAAPPKTEIHPRTQILQTINGGCISHCISVAAELGIADLLADGPMDAAGLAQATKSNPDGLYRILRTLAALGIFAELPERIFQNTPCSEVLRDDSPTSLRHYARWFGCKLHSNMWSGLDYSVRTGEPSIFSTHPGQSPFEVLAQHPADQERFNKAMTALSAADGVAIVQAYDFTRFPRIVDVGGGTGMLSMLIAEAAPASKVTLFDLPHVVESAKGTLPPERIEAVGGSIFNQIAGPADLCVMKHILHDWSDTEAVKILGNCRKVLNPGGRVLVCELVVTPGPEGLAAAIMDIEMLVGPGGRERTEREFADLFTAAGLRLARVVKTRTSITLLEAVPVS